jgi:hypothetical protein
VLNTIQLLKANPPQVFANASENVELLAGKLLLDAGSPVCSNTALVRIGSTGQSAICNLNATLHRNTTLHSYICKGFVVTIIGTHELDVSICGEQLKGVSLVIHAVQPFRIFASQPSKVFASVSGASITLHGAFSSPLRQAMCFQNSLSLHPAIYIQESAAVCNIPVATAGNTSLCIGLGSPSNAVCIEIQVMDSPFPYVLSPNRIPSLLENSVTFVGTNFSALPNASIRCELKNEVATLTAPVTLTPAGVICSLPELSPGQYSVTVMPIETVVSPFHMDHFSSQLWVYTRVRS